MKFIFRTKITNVFKFNKNRCI